MATYLALKYGDYVYDATTDMPDTLNDGVKANLRTVGCLGDDGAFTAGGLIAARRFSAKGTLTISPTGNVQADALTFRNKRDAFYAAHLPGAPQQFWLDNDRYVMAEVESLPMIDWAQGLTHVDFEVGFYAADPFQYQGDPATPYTPQSNTTVLTAGGASVPASNTSQSANPTVATVLAAAAGATGLLAGTYEVAYSWRDQFGETQVSPTSNVTITAGQQINVSAIALPTGVVLANLYMSIAAGSATLAWVQTWNGTPTSITALPVSPNSTNVNVGGTIYSLPTLSIQVTASPTSGGIAEGLVYGTVTGGGLTWEFALAPTATGTYVIDGTRQNQRVMLAGAEATSIFSGTFPRLAPNGVNGVTVGVSGGAAVGACSISWQNRWPNL